MKHLLMKFSADWCSQCKVLDKSIATANPDVPIRYIDIDGEPTLAEQYKIRTLPTCILFDESGAELKRFSGAKSPTQLNEWINA